MVAYYKANFQLFSIFFIWLIIGKYAPVISYAVIPITMFLMYKKGMIEELLIGYFFILILSDSLEDSLFFAKNVKNIYISVLAVFFFFDTKNFQPLNKLYKLYVPFFIFALFTISISLFEPFFFTGFQKTISFAISLMIIPNFITRLYREGGGLFLKRIVFFAVTILIIGFILKYVAHDFAYLENGRYRGFLGSPNGLGIYSVLTFIIFFVIDYFFPSLFTKQERIILIGAILLSIFLSGSRNSVFAILIFYFFQRFFSVSPFLGFILFLLTLFVSELISTNLSSILNSIGLGEFFRTKTLEEGSGRYIAWNFAWIHIQQNFFIGKGFAYNEFYMRQYYALLSKLGHQGGIHNSFLTFWMDQGLIGLLIYLRSYILMFIKSAKQTKFAYPILFALSFTAIFESWLVASLSPFAFLAIFIFTIITSDEIVPQEYMVSKEQALIKEPVI
ncbi:MAG: hypothetical protein A3F72_13820 [Bacteroidetes bacterium RIFCSPLOWO2_12_FULL_35_15]|nr:MAG: hypothetical protein A3F72_13820 [Bacteroidetes bacterium RIFCSPLOWO2_12_FULL_35_15]